MSLEEDDYEYDYSDDEDYQFEDVDDDELGDVSMTDFEQGNGGNPNAAPVAGSYKSGIRMLPCEDLVPEMKRRLQEVTEVLNIPPEAAAVLLREHNWSKEVLLEIFYNNAEKLLKKCGVFARCSNPKTMTLRSRSAQDCAICYESLDQSLAMPCGHEFCAQCWKDFVVTAIQEEGPACVRTTCPQAGCTEVMTQVEVTAAAPKALPKYLTFQLKSFVESNTLTRWCPGKGCEKVACALSAAAMEMEEFCAFCESCDIRFCIRCGEEPHSPCGCKELSMWKDKCRNESETANWILANTKSCPKCVSRIEKNQGCNHMTCQRCKHEFCWICMGDWSDHGANTGGYYKCNKYDSSSPGGGNLADNDSLSDAQRAKRELDRYLHYYKRYHAHSEAQTFAKKQLKETETRMVLLQESSDDAKWSDVEFLKTANEQLVECRRVLKYTYVYAYYLPSTTSASLKERFEHHQEMLERFTENLSELSERPLAEMDRTDVVNQTRVVDRFMKNVLKYVEDGMDEI